MSAGIETNESRGEALREAMGPQETEFSYPPEHGPVQYLLRDADGDESVLTFRELVEYHAADMGLDETGLDTVRLLSPGEDLKSPMGWMLTRENERP